MAISKGFLCNRSYNAALAQSIDELMAENSKSNPNFLHFLEVFYNLMQSRVDAPLEIIWCYCYLNFRCLNLDQGDLLQRAVGASELFLQISRCSASCKPKKSAVLLAPLLFQLMNLFEDLSLEKNLGSKLWKKACKRIISLTSQIIGYIGACCIKEVEDDDDASESLKSFDDLVNLWRYEKRTSSPCSLFLVHLEKRTNNEHENKGLDLNILSGILIANFFLLKLCCDLRFGNRGPQKEKELRSWSASSINAFQNIFFFDSIMMMLLESPMQTSSLIGPEAEHILKSILYDAVILVDYRFLTSERVSRLSEIKSKEILIKRVLIVCEAIEFFRSCGDHNRGYLYTTSFSNSKFYLHMVKQCLTGAAIEDEMEKLKGLSPFSLLKWLVEFKVEGVKLFDDTKLLKRAKLGVKDVGVGSRSEKTLSDGELFYIDNKGCEENGVKENDKINESVNAAFVAAAHTMKVQMVQKGRKRRREANNREKKRHKFEGEEDEEYGESSSSLDGEDGSLSSETELENTTDDG